MAGAAQKRGIETSLSGVQGQLISRRLLGSNNHGNSLGRLVARSATSILLAGIAAALVYESTQLFRTVDGATVARVQRPEAGIEEEQTVRTGQAKRCSDMDMSAFEKGRSCGPPLTAPCFDFSRCASNTSASGGVAGPKIYVFDSDCSLSDSESPSFHGKNEDGLPNIGAVFQNAAREAGVLAATYESACVFLYAGRAEREPCAVNTPLWNSGANHVMVNFGDNSRGAQPKAADSFAMFAASNMPSCLYRSGYDVSVPLNPKKPARYLAEIGPLDRKFFLTFKGSVYLGERAVEERYSILPLHDETNGVIMAMGCSSLHGHHQDPKNLAFCRRLQPAYKEYDYQSLMNTTFGLVPAGRSPATYRLVEAMGAGAIPVVVARDFVLPFREQLDWPSFSFSFAPDQVGPELVRTLRAIPQMQLEEMQKKSLDAYHKMFGDDDSVWGNKATTYGPTARNLVEILRHRMEHRGGR